MDNTPQTFTKKSRGVETLSTGWNTFRAIKRRVWAISPTSAEYRLQDTGNTVQTFIACYGDCLLIPLSLRPASAGHFLLHKSFVISCAEGSYSRLFFIAIIYAGGNEYVHRI